MGGTVVFVGTDGRSAGSTHGGIAGTVMADIAHLDAEVTQLGGCVFATELAHGSSASSTAHDSATYFYAGHRSRRFLKQANSPKWCFAAFLYASAACFGVL